MLAPLTTRTARALLSPSARVLAAAALPDCGVGIAAELPWHDVHWPTLVALVPHERAESQVFRLLRAAPEGAVPADVQRAVQSMYRVARFRSAELADAAAIAVNALDRAGVQGLWLKGAALAMRSPQDFEIRGMGDLDVLVGTAFLGSARAALGAAGWVAVPDHHGYDRHHHAAPMVWRNTVRLELHSALFPPGHPFADDDARVWLERGEWLERNACRQRVLPAEWHLVHASTHWAWSHEGRVGSWQYLHDVHCLTAGWRADGPEWSRVVDHAGTSGTGAAVGWALWCASRLADAAVPEAVLWSLRDGARLLDGLAEREWVLRAFHSPMASPSVAWSRFWWRRALRGLGDARQQWPWALGRGADVLPGSPSEAIPADRPLPSASGLGRQSARWRRHLFHVLRA
ncbi:MAG TPA: nucleotidyltransferase family protein [Gemmatimonadaceae bacterium]|nr:nucleotidyltransferase family protein [Gemmatimonadaceae bacterium]